MQCKVAKFGGSSLADAVQFKKVHDIIKADPAIRFIVPSAPGRRFSEDFKVTDMLYRCYDKCVKGEDSDADFTAIEERFDGIIRDLGLDISLQDD